VNELIESIKLALSKIDRRYCLLAEGRYQERVICYEFYHQFRNLIDSRKVNLGGRVIQGEVDKGYQDYKNLDKIPDFIFHVPNTEDNLAVVEFKLASDLNGITKDLRKLIAFGETLNYRHLVQVIIGDTKSLSRARKYMKSKRVQHSKQIRALSLDTTSWEVCDWKIP